MKALQAFIFNYSCNGTHVGVNKEKEKEREREREKLRGMSSFLLFSYRDLREYRAWLPWERYKYRLVQESRYGNELIAAR